MGRAVEARVVATREEADSDLEELLVRERPNCNMYWYRFFFRQSYYFIGEYRQWTYDLEAANLSSTGPLYV